MSISPCRVPSALAGRRTSATAKLRTNEEEPRRLPKRMTPRNPPTLRLLLRGAWPNVRAGAGPVARETTGRAFVLLQAPVLVELLQVVALGRCLPRTPVGEEGSLRLRCTEAPAALCDAAAGFGNNRCGLGWFCPDLVVPQSGWPTGPALISYVSKSTCPSSGEAEARTPERAAAGRGEESSLFILGLGRPSKVGGYKPRHSSNSHASGSFWRALIVTTCFWLGELES